MSGVCNVCEAQSTSCPGFKAHKFKPNICQLCEHAESAHTQGRLGESASNNVDAKSKPIYDNQPPPPDDVPPPPPPDEDVVDLTKPKAMNIPSGSSAPKGERKASTLKSAIPIPESEEERPSPSNKKSLDLSVSANGNTHRLNPKAPLTMAPPLSVEMSSRYTTNPIVMEKESEFELTEDTDNEALRTKSVYWIPENKTVPIELNISDPNEMPEEGKIEKEENEKNDQDDVEYIYILYYLYK